MPNDHVPATAIGLPTRRTPLAARSGLPEADASEAHGAEERIRQFAEWFGLEMPSIEYDPDDGPAGGPLMTDELLAWIRESGAAFDWIIVGDARGMVHNSYREARHE